MHLEVGCCKPSHTRQQLAGHLCPIELMECVDEAVICPRSQLVFIDDPQEQIIVSDDHHLVFRCKALQLFAGEFALPVHIEAYVRVESILLDDDLHQG